jgi:hypothetical protein
VLPLTLLTLLALQEVPQAQTPAAPEPPVATAPVEPSKKQLFLEEKEKAQTAPPVHRKSPARTASACLTLYNAWTHEVLPVPADETPPAEEVSHFLRCHFTNQFCEMDPRLIPVVRRAAQRFRATRIEVVSGFRSAKYNLMLRKKGHEVARESEHPRGQAIDFRIPQVPTRTLLRFVRSLRVGGVGYYPESHFVHADTGRVRYWKGH